MFDLFLAFFKIGLFTFGGGYAMVAVVEDTCVEKKKWITHEEMMELIVIAESTPGPIAINCAAYVGYRQKGIWGAVCATAGMVVPSLLVIYTISRFLDGFLEIGFIANAFRGIKVGVGIIIVNAGIKMIKDVPKDKLSRGILICATVIMLAVNLFALNLSTITLLIAAGILGVAAYLVKGGDRK